MNSEVLVDKIMQTSKPCLSSTTRLFSTFASPVQRTLILMWMLVASFSAAAVSAQSFDDGVESYLAGRYDEALQIWTPLATDNDAVAMFNIGVLHAQGLGVKQDPAAAVDWYRKAADRGYAPAQFNLGASYHNGQGVERDDELAASWWQLAADQGEVQAQYHLAVLYLEGRGVSRDDTTARYFLEQAARQGDSRAAETLSDLVDNTANGTSPQVSEIVTDTESTQPTTETVSDAADQAPESVTGIVPDSGETTVEEAEVTRVDTQPRVVTAENGSTVIYTTESAQMAVSDVSEWVKDYDASSYTIQLLATKELAAAERFIAQNKLEGRAQVFFAGATEKPLYKVVYGNYVNSSEANRERKNLPEALMKNTPWIRDFGSIQAEATMQAAPGADTSVVATTTETVSPAADTSETVQQVVVETVESSEAVTEDVATTVTEVVSESTETVVEQVPSSDTVEAEVSETVSTEAAVPAVTEESVEQAVVVANETVTETVTETINAEAAVVDQTAAEVVSSETAEASVTSESTVTNDSTVDTGTSSTNAANNDSGGETVVTETTSGETTMTESTTAESTIVVADQTTETQMNEQQPQAGVSSVVVQPDNAPEPSLPESDSAAETTDVTTENAETTTVAVIDSQPDSTDINSEDAVESFTLGQRAFNRQDYETALSHWRPLAESGHAEAQYGLGFMYETGWGVQRAASEALEWYRKSAEQGYAKAQYNLGMMFLVGNGVPTDESMGLFWIQSAADQNDLRARARLSRMRSNDASTTN